ncbi:flagellar export chaperone FliS [Motilibacter aurantiacus]|uniref:flagellar export chaperone FliS n=1 Tax=Motilibacter aurantiacus TaxID=2714955 RepID=UPI00140E620C|nr:flagellar export chaperone FliS [Motilibacter aurantiacus]
MYANARNRYAQDSVGTASPARLLTMLYDRLVLDLQRAEAALAEADRSAANTALTHAQDILSELRNTLKVDAWQGGPALASLYAWWITELVGANVRGDARRIAMVRAQVEPLRAAWHAAAAQAASAAPAAVLTSA